MSNDSKYTPTTQQMVDCLKDHDEQKKSVYLRARRAVIEQLNAIEPDMAALREDLHDMMSRRGPDSIFEKDDHMGLSVNDALLDNRDRAAAKPAVDYVSKEISRRMRDQNWAQKARRESADRMFQK